MTRADELQCMLKKITARERDVDDQNGNQRLVISQVFEDVRKKLEHKEREMYAMVDESRLRAKAELETAKRILA